MLSDQTYFMLFNFAYFVVCLKAAAAGILVVRYSLDFATLLSRLKSVMPYVGVLALIGAAAAMVFVGFNAAAYVLGLFSAFCVGIVLDIVESDPSKFKAAVGEFASESMKSYGKLPTSH